MHDVLQMPLVLRAVEWRREPESGLRILIASKAGLNKAA
jgi:hypothetical protein